MEIPNVTLIDRWGDGDGGDDGWDGRTDGRTDGRMDRDGNPMLLLPQHRAGQQSNGWMQQGRTPQQNYKKKKQLTRDPEQYGQFLFLVNLFPTCR